MAKRLALLVAGVAAAASFATPASADPLTWCTHRPLLDCVKELVKFDLCIPNGDLESPC